MADCKNCHYGAEGGGGNFGMMSIVCCYYGPLECDPDGDCQNFEDVENSVQRICCTDYKASMMFPKATSYHPQCVEAAAQVKRLLRKSKLPAGRSSG